MAFIKFYEPLKRTQNVNRIVNSGIGNCNEANAVLNEIAMLKMYQLDLLV